MTRNFFCFVLACILFAAASADAGERSNTRHWRSAPDLESFDFTTGPVAAPKLSKTTAATQIGSTYYDYMWNGGSPTHLVYHNGVSYNGYIGRISATDPREFTYVSYDGSTFLTPTAAISGSVQSTYFSGVDVFRGGAVDGICGIAAGWAGAGLSYWCVEATPGQGDFAQFESTDERDTQPLILSNEGEVIIYHTAGRTDYGFVRSTDFGVTWAELNPGILSQGTRPAGQAQGTLDVSLLLAPNGNVIVGTTNAGAGEGTPYPDGVNPDSADEWGYFTSTDGGATFTFTRISYDGEETLPGYWNLAENFSGGDFAVDGNNNVHACSNGYSVRVSDSSGTIGVTYWNQAVGFKELTTGLFDKEWDIIPNDVLTYYPGNAIGCAYPTMAVSDDGQFVVVVWSQPGFTETTIDTLDGYLLHDLYYNYSADGGATWNTPTQLTSTPDRSELFATLADDIEVVSPGTYRLRVLYMEDTTPGASPFAESDPGDEPIMYMEFDVTPATSVEPIDGTVPETYALKQNYPNPFNPTTNIVYSIPQSTFVTLKVYDLLGSEVATLVNEFQNAGNYTVDFNAANLANGAYFYRLTAGSFTDVKKMALMK